MWGKNNMYSINNDKVVLQVKYPMITSFTTDAHMLAILNNYPITEEWIFNNYINLWGEKLDDIDEQLYIRFGSWFIRKSCPYFKINTYYKEFFESIKCNIIEFIISKIQLGRYLNISYDQFYIPNSPKYMKYHFQHQLLIYGYDKTLKTFYIADFYASSRYSFENASFDSVELAIINSLNLDNFLCDEIEFYYTNYKFNNDFLYNSLNNLLHSKNNVLQNENIFISDIEIQRIQENKYTFGMENYNLLKNTLLGLLNGNNKFNDVKPLHIIFQHKVIMSERLKFLAKKKLINPNDDIINEYVNLQNISNLCRNLFMKYQVTHDNKLLNKIISNLDLLISSETDAITCLINKVSGI